MKNFGFFFFFLSEIMFESFNIPGLYIAVQVRICYSIILKKSAFNVILTPASQTLGLLIISSVPSPVSSIA